MKILEFNTEAEAESALSVVNQIAAAFFQAHGFTVEPKADSPSGLRVVSKSAATGQDRPDACGTETWDTVKESPDSTFYFTSPSVKPAYADWRDNIPEGVPMPADKDFPESWNVMEEV